MCFKQITNTVSISGTASKVLLDPTATNFSRPSNIPNSNLNGDLTGPESLPQPSGLSITQGGASAAPQDGETLWACCQCGHGPYNTSLYIVTGTVITGNEYWIDGCFLFLWRSRSKACNRYSTQVSVPDMFLRSKFYIYTIMPGLSFTLTFMRYLRSWLLCGAFTSSCVLRQCNFGFVFFSMATIWVPHRPRESIRHYQ
ncbi:hypothetical protein K490DRAFT_58758 [Saccharata proteae CBS 121410]|uniref:Uncharacterized protein n=1 Tax=Saccharata proteae CBS 121410 TaxID=1314787 RepID=A0A9P4HRM3_9PEZI|nr:hypothetical protein K490DRAFT_58758 [Saccharata proteae CBS 121410]